MYLSIIGKLNKEFNSAHPNIFYFKKILISIQKINYFTLRSIKEEKECYQKKRKK